MSQYIITTMEELAAVVTEDNVDILAEDLTTWLRLAVQLKNSPVLKMDTALRWNDDGTPGVKSVTLNLKDGA